MPHVSLQEPPEPLPPDEGLGQSKALVLVQSYARVSGRMASPRASTAVLENSMVMLMAVVIVREVLTRQMG